MISGSLRERGREGASEVDNRGTKRLVVMAKVKEK